jgi:hypothetical protein
MIFKKERPRLAAPPCTFPSTAEKCWQTKVIWKGPNKQKPIIIDKSERMCGDDSFDEK